MSNIVCSIGNIRVLLHGGLENFMRVIAPSVIIVE